MIGINIFNTKYFVIVQLKCLVIPLLGDDKPLVFAITKMELSSNKPRYVCSPAYGDGM